MAHTPGPWRFLMEEDGDEETGGYGVDIWTGGIVTPNGEGDYEDICEVWPQDEANGRLICAAPDLLAACELLAAELIPFYPDRQKYDKWRDSMDDDLAACYDAVWAAIGKSKGETP